VWASSDPAFEAHTIAQLLASDDGKLRTLAEGLPAVWAKNKPCCVHDPLEATVAVAWTGQSTRSRRAVKPLNINEMESTA
jgi:hypothetical protein